MLDSVPTYYNANVGYLQQNRKVCSLERFGLGSSPAGSANYSGRKAARVKFSVALSNSFLFFIFGVAMGREITLRATS